MRAAVTGLIAGIASQCVSAQYNIRTDPMVAGPSLEVVHLYDGQWPTGVAVSKNGRKFSSFPAGLDPLNNNALGLGLKFQVAELKGMSNETPYPNEKMNNPPGGTVNRLVVPPRARGLKNYFIGVQSVYVDSEDTLWALDTGRVIDVQGGNSPLLQNSPGGCKLVGFNLANNSMTHNFVFPSNVCLPTSYLNDVRVDNTRNFAYISDSSPEGQNGIVVLNLSTGKSFRQLTPDNSPAHPLPSVVPFVYGKPMYELLHPIQQALNPGYITFGADGLTLDPTGNTLYFSVIAGRYLYSVPTAALRQRADATAQVKNLGEKGISDGLETDSNGIVYAGNVEQDAISMYNPVRGLATIFVRDPRINWVDTMSIATDGYMYFTVNQLNDLLEIYPGEGVPLVDRRQRPFVLFRAKLPGGGTKIQRGSG